MNFSVLDFFKYISRMPQIVQILVLTFKVVQGRERGWGVRGVGGMLLEPPRNFIFFFLFFFSIVIPGSGELLCQRKMFAIHALLVV